MSNTIAVKTGRKISYFSFRWDGDVLLAFVSNEWRAVWRTNKRNKYGDIVFELAN